MPAGYEAWKDEVSIPGPRWGLIITVLIACFVLGGASVAGIMWYLLSPKGDVEVATAYTPLPLPPTYTPTALPTATVTPTPTHIPKNVAISYQPTALPSTIEATPNLQATLDAMVLPTVEAVPDIFCGGATFRDWSKGTQLMVSFETKGALNLLTQPRTVGTNTTVIRLLYDTYRVDYLGDYQCGEWKGMPVVYYHVKLLRFNNEIGWVGLGAGGDIWLENIG